MTAQEAINNIAIVISNARMTGPEHDALRQSIAFVVQRCKLADELEKQIAEVAEAKKEVKEETKPEFGKVIDEDN